MMPRRRCVSFWLLSLTLICSFQIVAASANELAAPLAVADRESLPMLAGYAGDWSRLSDTDSDLGRLNSIESAVSGLSWVVRKMAGGVLRSSTKPPGQIEFNWDGSRLSQRTEGPNGAFDRVVEINGPPITLLDARGDEFESNWVLTPDGLEVHWRQEQAFGTNRYRIGADSQTLHVEHRIQVTAIDNLEPILYESHFRKAAPLPSVSSAAAVEVGHSSKAPPR